MEFVRGLKACLLRLWLIVALLINSAGPGYALRPIAAAQSVTPPGMLIPENSSSAGERKLKVPAGEKDRKVLELFREAEKIAGGKWYRSIQQFLRVYIPGSITVYYPGAGLDLNNAISATDADIFIFVDKTVKQLPLRIKKEIRDNGGIIRNLYQNGNEYILRFYMWGKERALYYYASTDASNKTQLPQRVKDGYDVYMEKRYYSSRGASNAQAANNTFYLGMKYLKRDGFVLLDHYPRGRSFSDSYLLRFKTLGVRFEDQEKYYFCFFGQCRDYESNMARNDSEQIRQILESRDKEQIRDIIEMGIRGDIYNVSITKELEIRRLLVRSKNLYVRSRLSHLYKTAPKWEKKKIALILTENIFNGCVPDKRIDYRTLDKVKRALIHNGLGQDDISQEINKLVEDKILLQSCGQARAPDAVGAADRIIAVQAIDCAA